MKYEEVYLKHYQTVFEIRDGLAKYFLFYNTDRIHEALDYRTPYELYAKERMKTTTTQALPNAPNIPLYSAIFCLDNGERLKVRFLLVRIDCL